MPCGRIALGRIFNVVGSIIDPYISLSLSAQFNTLCPIDLGRFVESHPSLTYTLSYPSHILSLSLSLSLSISLYNTMIISPISLPYILYSASLYQNFLHLNWTPVYIPYLPCTTSTSSMLILNSTQHSINALPTTHNLLFYSTDTLFASSKPIHRTPLAIITLRI